LRIDPANAIGGNVSDIFDLVNYIPLETTTESTFGSISQLAIVNDYYVILDRSTNSILFFTKAGKFHAKIKGKTSSPSYMIWKFLINKWTKQLANFTDIVYCDFDGKVIKTEKAEDPQTSQRNYWRGYFISKNEILSCSDYRNLDSLSKGYTPAYRSLIKYFKSDGTIYSTGLPYTRAEGKIDVLGSLASPLTNFGNDTTFFFSKPYANNIYTITPNTIRLSYKLVFPLANSLPVDFISNTDYNGKRIFYIEKNRSSIFYISNCYQLGSNLLFKTGSYSATRENNLIYNLKSGDLIAYKHILPDEQSFFLPIYDEIGSSFENYGISACDGEYLYTSLSSLCVFKAKEDNVADKKLKYNAVLTDYFAKSTKDSNPVILQLKIKSDL
jgi:hypothetical protein